MLGTSGMYPNGIQPIKKNRNENINGLFYSLIDFGLSHHNETRDVTDVPLRGVHKLAPEHRSKRRCNPFKTDIHYIGNLVRHKFMEIRAASWVSVYTIYLILLSRGAMVTSLRRIWSTG